MKNQIHSNSSTDSPFVMIINGQVVDLLNLKDADMEITKMVRGLQGIIRFNGYSGWSVAEHSFLLSHIVENVAKKVAFKFIASRKPQRTNSANTQADYEFGYSHSSYIPEELLPQATKAFTINSNAFVERFASLMALDALIHDFSESLTGDIIRPFKMLVPEIRETEDKIDQQIRKFHGCLPEMPKIVDVLDKCIAVIEAYYLTRYDNKTLINEYDEFQVRKFNDLVVRDITNKEESILMLALSDKLNNNDVPVIDKPLSNKFLFAFLSLSEYSISDIKSMSKNRLLELYVKRYNRLIDETR